MTNIQRWNGVGAHHDDKGWWVAYADHVEALRQAEQRAWHWQLAEDAKQRGYDLGYEQGQRDVFAFHPEWTVSDMCKPGCLACQRLTELINERATGYEEGRQDALKDVPVEGLITVIRKAKEVAVALEAFEFLRDCRDLEKQLLAMRSS